MGELFFVDFYLQQIEVHQSGIERQVTYTNAHVLGFQSLVSYKVVEAIFLVIMECLRTVEGIDDEEATPCAVVGTEKHFDKIHDGSAETLS